MSCWWCSYPDVLVNELVSILQPGAQATFSSPPPLDWAIFAGLEPVEQMMTGNAGFRIKQKAGKEREGWISTRLEAQCLGGLQHLLSLARHRSVFEVREVGVGGGTDEGESH